MKLKLSTPLQFGKKTIDEPNLRDYTIAGDYLAFDQRGGVSQNIALIASLSGMDEAVIQRIRGKDYVAASAYVDKLLKSDGEADDGDDGDDADDADDGPTKRGDTEKKPFEP
jgi:hypothetical protein